MQAKIARRRTGGALRPVPDAPFEPFVEWFVDAPPGG